MKALVVAVVVSLWFANASAAKETANRPTIQLLDAGKGPKQQLRYTATKGLKRTVTLTMEMAMRMNMGRSPTTQKLPVMKLPVELVVTDVATNGDIRYDFKALDFQVVADGSVSQAVVDAAKSALEGMAGMTGTALVTSRGFTKEVDINVPPSASPQIKQLMAQFKQSISQFAAPLPTEAVGTGAKWKTTSKLKQNDVEVAAVATTELVALEGNVATLQLSMALAAPAQKIKANGVEVELKSMKGSGGGDSTLDLSQVMPMQAAISMTMDMQMSAGGQDVTMGMDMKMSLGAK
jgi:hypothetical protein